MTKKTNKKTVNKCRRSLCAEGESHPSSSSLYCLIELRYIKKNQKGKKEKTNHHRHSFSSAKRERDMRLYMEHKHTHTETDDKIFFLCHHSMKSATTTVMKEKKNKNFHSI